MMAAQRSAPRADHALAEQIGRRMRKDVFRRYALLRNDELVFCGPAGGKITYTSMENAVAAAAELLRLGSVPQNAYECPKKPGHYHLHRDAPPLARRERRTR